MKFMWALGGSGVLHLTFALVLFKAGSPSPTAFAEPISTQANVQFSLLPVTVLSASSSAPRVGPAPLARIAPRSTRRSISRSGHEKFSGPAEAVTGSSTDDDSAEPARGPFSQGAITIGGDTEPSSASHVSTFDVAALHRGLAQSARKCYPAAARRFQLKGTSQVEFCLTAEGALASANVTSSSGEALLDTAAVRCVIPNALPLPIDAFGRCFRAPVRFGFESGD